MNALLQSLHQGLPARQRRCRGSLRWCRRGRRCRRGRQRNRTPVWVPRGWWGPGCERRLVRLCTLLPGVRSRTSACLPPPAAVWALPVRWADLPESTNSTGAVRTLGASGMFGAGRPARRLHPRRARRPLRRVRRYAAPFGHTGTNSKHMQKLFTTRAVSAWADPDSHRWWVLRGGGSRADRPPRTHAGVDPRNARSTGHR